MFDRLTEFVADASGWAYAMLFLLALLDAVLPVVPAETAVITAGVVASSGRLSIWLAIAAAALGAFAGDNLAYWVGRRRLSRITARGGKFAARLAWAGRRLAERGGQLLLAARFIPGGRTAVTLAAGATGYDRRRFLILDAIAATTWAAYAALLGHLGGRAFEDQPWKGLLLAIAAALLLTGLGELARWVVRRKRSDDA